MLIVTLKNGTSKAWHVGSPRPLVHINDVDSVQADGDELQYIMDNFSSLPMVKGRWVVRWHGDDAKFIFDHLKER